MKILLTMTSLWTTFLYTTLSLAAPAPGLISAAHLQNDHQLIASNIGFSITAKDTNWKIVEDTEATKNRHSQIKPPKGNALLSIKINKNIKQNNLKDYVKYWRNDYQRLGLEVLKAQPIKINGNVSYMMDLYNSKSEIQLRQVMLLKNGNSVVLTCSDNKEAFKESFKDCNKILKTFTWLE